MFAKGADMELNFGIRGFALFLWSHRRNDIDAWLSRHILVDVSKDQLLNLPVFALSAHEAHVIERLRACHQEKHLAPSKPRTVSQLIATSKEPPLEVM